MVRPLVFPPAPQLPPRQLAETPPLVNPVTFSANSPAAARPAPAPIANRPNPVIVADPAVSSRNPSTRDAAATSIAPLAPLFGNAASPLSATALKLVESKSAELYVAHKQRFELYVSQLLPVRLDRVVDWGGKTMERLRTTSSKASKLTSEFVSYDGNKLLESAVKSLQGTSGFFSKITQKKPTDFEPQIAALSSFLIGWMATCTDLIGVAKKNLEDSLLKSVSLSAVCDAVGDHPDQTLAHTMHNRRAILQQSAMQAELLVRQLESTYQQMLDQRMRADQVLNVTIPAWKTAAANK